MNTKPSWNRWFLARKTSATSVKMRPLQTKMMFEQIWLKYATCLFLCVRDIIFALQVANIQHTCKSCMLLNSKHLALFEFWQGFSPAYCYYIFPLFDLHWWQMSSCFSKSLENAAIASGLPIFHPLSSRHENERESSQMIMSLKTWKHHGSTCARPKSEGFATEPFFGRKGTTMKSVCDACPMLWGKIFVSLTRVAWWRNC